MVKIMENPIQMDDLGGKTPIFGNTHVGSHFYPVFERMSAGHVDESY